MTPNSDSRFSKQGMCVFYNQFYMYNYTHLFIYVCLYEHIVTHLYLFVVKYIPTLLDFLGIKKEILGECSQKWAHFCLFFEFFFFFSA